MPFREKAKNLFKTKGRGDSLSKTSTNGSESRDRYPSNVYKPGEPMPLPKYRRPPQKEHKEKLEAFSFADAWRKKSFQSAYSPMGTRAHSRRNSVLSMGRKSLGRRSEDLRSNSVTSGDTEKSSSGAGQRQETITATKMKAAQQQEEEEQQGGSALTAQSRPRTAEDKQTNGLYKTVTAHDHKPFSEEDLASALHRSNMEVSAQS